ARHRAAPARHRPYAAYFPLRRPRFPPHRRGRPGGHGHSRVEDDLARPRGEVSMLRILGAPKTTCDGLSRRELLRVGGLSLFGALHQPALAATGARHAGKAKSVILLDLFGGPSHLDTFDPKPDAPAEVRGEFGTIDTSLPGLRICEHLPRTARWMHRVA